MSVKQRIIRALYLAGEVGCSMDELVECSGARTKLGVNQVIWQLRTKQGLNIQGPGPGRKSPSCPSIFYLRLPHTLPS